MATKFIGLDYSMNSPGLCVMHSNGSADLYAFSDSKVEINKYTHDNLTFSLLPNVGKGLKSIARFDALARKVMMILNTYELSSEEDEVWMEGYSMGSKGQVFNIAENTAIMKHYLFRAGFAINEVAPTLLKKYATGSGRAQKEDMHDAFMKQTGVDLRKIITPNRKLGSPVSDLIDAYYVSSYGRHIALA